MNTNPAAKTVLCYGDSNTWGQKPGRDGRYPANVRWTGVLQDTLGDNYSIIEEGMGGRTTDADYANRPGRNGRTYLEPCLDSHWPLDVVILMLGTNDFKLEFNRSTDDVAAALRGLVEMIRVETAGDDHSPATIVLVSPVPIDASAKRFDELYKNHYDQNSVAESARLADILQKAADELECVFVDAAAVAQAGDDGIHLTQDSHKALLVSYSPRN